MSNSRSYQPVLIADVVANPSAPGVVALTTLAAQVLPDGCEAFALSNRTLYRLNKLSTDSPLGGAAGGLVSAQGGGNWVPQSASQGALGVASFGDVAVAFDGVSNFHTIIGTFANVNTGAEWSLDTSTGVATWRGPSNQRFAVDANISGYNDTTVIETFLGLSIDSSTSIPSTRQSKATSPVATGSAAVYQLHLTTVIELDQGQTVRLMAAGASSNLTIPFLNFTLTPLN